MLANDLPALRREYVSVMAMVALLAVPAVAGFAACAPFLVLLVLGPKWIQAASLIRVIAFYGITTVLQSNAYSAFLALGRPQVFVKVTAIHVAILLMTLLGLTPRYGIEGAAWAYVLTSALIMPIDFYMITRYLGLRPIVYVAQLWRPVCGAAVMYLGVRVLGPPMPTAALSALQAAYSLITCIVLGVAFYSLSIVVFWLVSRRPDDSAEGWVLRRLQSTWARRSNVPRA